jgi:thiamine pyrophosphate-dependent acetolactate synthase large subunit-like protein
VIVPAAGATHAASGIGEAFLDGIPMLVICGGIRTDLDKKYQLHEMDQHAFVKALTKASFLVSTPRRDRADAVHRPGRPPTAASRARSSSRFR